MIPAGTVWLLSFSNYVEQVKTPINPGMHLCWLYPLPDLGHCRCNRIGKLTSLGRAQSIYSYNVAKNIFPTHPGFSSPCDPTLYVFCHLLPCSIINLVFMYLSRHHRRQSTLQHVLPRHDYVQEVQRALPACPSVRKLDSGTNHHLIFLSRSTLIDFVT